MRKENYLLSIIIPIFNESSTLSKLCTKIDSVCRKSIKNYEIIFVDDGSSDDSLFKLQSLKEVFPLKVVSFSRNFGKESAITAGLKHTKGDLVLIMDGDGQHPPEMIPELVSYWKKGIDNIYTVRISRDDQPLLIRYLSKLFYKLHSSITEIKIPANAGDFRLLDRKVVDALNRLEEKQRYMKGLYSWVGFPSLAVPYEPLARSEGKSRFKLKSLLGLALLGITSFSNWPLRLWVLVGAFVAFSSLLYGFYILFETVVFGIITPGFPTLTVCLLFLGGVQLISIGVVGEYVANIFDEVKKRPHYVIEKKFGFEQEEK